MLLLTRLRASVVFGFAVILLLSFAPVHAAAINVTTTTDENAPVTGDTGCSLREAVTAANTNTAYGGCPAGDAGADTISIPAGVFQSSNTLGTMTITSEIDFVGAGTNSTFVQGGPNAGSYEFPIFTVAAGANADFSSMTLRYGGRSQAVPGVIGGAMRVDGTASIGGDVVLSENRAQRGGGVYIGSGGSFTANSGSLITNGQGFITGGAVHVASGGSAFLYGDITGNIAASGAGVFIEGGSVVIDDINLSHNRAVLRGGAIFFSSGALSVTDSRLQFNGYYTDLGDFSLDQGSAIYSGVSAGNSSITNSCIVGNPVEAITNVGAGTVTATGNWWGDDEGAGPVGPSDAGDTVTAGVDFSSPLTSAPIDCAVCTIPSGGGYADRVCSP